VECLSFLGVGVHVRATRYPIKAQATVVHCWVIKGYKIINRFEKRNVVFYEDVMEPLLGGRMNV